MKKEKRLRSGRAAPRKDEHLRLSYLTQLFRKKRRKQKKVKEEEKRLQKLREEKRAKFGTRPTNLRHKERMQYTHQRIQLRTDGFGLVLPKPKQLKNIARLNFNISNPNPKPKRGPGRPRKIKKVIFKPEKVSIPRLELSQLNESIEEAKQEEEIKEEEEFEEDEGLQELYHDKFGQMHEGLSTVSFYSRYAFIDRYSVLLGRKENKGNITLKKMKIKDMYQNYPGTLLEYLRKVDSSL